MTSIHFLVAKLLRNTKRYDLPNEAKACPSASVAWLKNVNRRTDDVAASRQFLFSIHIAMNLQESPCSLEQPPLHQIATLHHDELGQETLLNLLLCNYLHCSLQPIWPSREVEVKGTTIWSTLKPAVQTLYLQPQENPDNSSGVYRCKRVYPAGCS